MVLPSSSNLDFLQNYSTVLEHHVECILRCRLILNEDMQLVSTFWKPPSLLQNIDKSKYSFKLGCSLAIGTISCLTLILTENVGLVVVSLLPTLFPIGESCKRFYLRRYYKSNFTKLLNYMTEIYTLNNDIMDYFHKRDSSIKNASISNEFLPFLLQPGEHFLQIASVKLTNFLKRLKLCMLNISELIPISDDPFNYFTDWNLEVQHFDDFVPLKNHYQKLMDYYHLMVSNFLSCIGLALCAQLWKNKSCNFVELFNKIIPDICNAFEKILQELRSEFDTVRFTLYDSEPKTPLKQDSHKFLVLQKPIDDVLTNLQITFQMVQQLKTQNGLNSSELLKLSPNFDKIEAQFQQSGESLHTLTKSFYLVTKQEPTLKVELSGSAPTKNNFVVNNVRHDDLPAELEDEEYNLSIHGSDDDDDEPNPNLNEYVDQCSTEHLELMFVELKKKLRERRAEKNGGVVEEEGDLAVVQPPPPPPVPPPRPSLRKDSDDIPNLSVTMPAYDPKFLDALKSVAQKFNREEVVFGSGNSDDDDIMDEL